MRGALRHRQGRVRGQAELPVRQRGRQEDRREVHHPMRHVQTDAVRVRGHEGLRYLPEDGPGPGDVHPRTIARGLPEERQRQPRFGRHHGEHRGLTRSTAAGAVVVNLLTIFSALFQLQLNENIIVHCDQNDT